mmetsp:Transcript_19421/g.50111  ORF Transcript_19421/g.50111 Transcript_19421/m.50111 type:complete len:238 (+) Transcript_19421:38-751(+)|eukprot:CAMPEP_0119406798 /NCGR_PEP_ID=MMETSP1335-20130426/984_1 /TAXON_ID=259385 /ORGANISM="Chrysoculter rhomboideus, Strain RCC1486" /LENGTH=237 /DNA_ID=CAMNT_0007430891 /DNA_START=290 /DNA_END=1003 /DNA_ORIENTATION=-
MLRAFVTIAVLFAVADAAARPKISGGPAKKVVKPKAVKKNVPMSESVPFQERPAKLDGSLVGDIGFDPLGLSNLWDLNWLRAAELKHGRVGMLASLGFWVQESYRLPGPASNPGLFTAAKTPLEALSTAPPLGLAQIVGVCFLIELATSSALLNTAALDENDPSAKLAIQSNIAPGDLGWDPIGLAANGVKPEYAIAELKHARLGMLGAAGMLAGSLVAPDKSITEQTYDWLNIPYN